MARVEMLQRLSGLGATRFTERFRARVGLAPKCCLRVLRFDRALTLLAERPRQPLADLALATGHADQAHFANEFRRMAGLTATRYRALAPADARHVPCGLPDRRFLQDVASQAA